MDWSTPKSFTDLSGFLGLSSYYHKFVRQYASITSPLLDLLKNPQFMWTNTARLVFDNLKRAMTSLLVLALLDFSQTFDITIDASSAAISVVVSQNSHPLAFFNKKMCPRLQASSTYKRELFAITKTVKKWRQYLMGRKFRIFLDRRGKSTFEKLWDIITKLFTSPTAPMLSPTLYPGFQSLHLLSSRPSLLQSLISWINFAPIQTATTSLTDFRPLHKCKASSLTDKVDLLQCLSSPNRQSIWGSKSHPWDIPSVLC